jgi:hypothetical protein
MTAAEFKEFRKFIGLIPLGIRGEVLKSLRAKAFDFRVAMDTQLVYRTLAGKVSPAHWDDRHTAIYEEAKALIQKRKGK